MHIGIGESSAQEIDDINILQATFLAMKRAVECLKIKPEIAIIDGNLKPKSFPCNAIAVVKGDSKSFSISAASIVAKVYRDKIMENIGIKYPNYGFEKHSGYGTKQHIDALKAHGVTKHHRTSYKPIKELLNK